MSDSARPQSDTGRWFQTGSGTFGQFMPSTFGEDLQRQRDGMCMEEITVDFTGRTKACQRPAVSAAFDTFTRDHYPVCHDHAGGHV